MENSSFEIPSLIPPLPSSSAMSNKENNEKGRGKPTQKQSPSISKVPRKPLGSRTPRNVQDSGNGQVTPMGHAELKDGRSPLCIQSTSATKKRLVLRYGETIESLFCITKESSEEHRRLAKEIVDGSLTDAPSSWRRVIEYASKENVSGADLTRLHRRATLRFSADKLKSENHEDILAIWHSFVKLQVKLGVPEEARRTFRHIENQKMKLGAAFYISLAEFEKIFDTAAQVNVGTLDGEEKANSFMLVDRDGKMISIQSDPQLHSTAIPTLQQEQMPCLPVREPSDVILSPKRRKLENGFTHEKPGAEEFFFQKLRQSDSKDFPSLENQSDSNIRRNEKGETNAIFKPSHPSSSSGGKLRSGVSSKTSGFVSSGKQFVSNSRQKFLSSRLGRKGLSGKAKRVDPGESFIQTSDSDDEDTVAATDLCLNSRTNPSVPEHKGPTSKLRKLDLGYMWEWDPNTRTRKDTNTLIDRTEGEASSNSGSTSTQGSICASNNNDKLESTTDRIEKPLEHVHSDTRVNTENQEIADNSRTERNKAEHLMAGVNAEFLPLVHESNILRVNGTSYAKLGVIGKGGSCKVYRALSKKCTVVAIKKVKIEGMDERAIEGYANEISLLKRLKGNPAIIQMHDSQVDLERKSILLVMELGEVDLNHVLQQRALSGSSRSLNMNFIRLTWQQMLSAVHCIHEERIIHSDLKPANFLFVRGALKLIDFGIAKAIQSDDTTNIYRESHIGTLNYMSPEAILDTGSGHNKPRMKIGRASDVWSLGCILYEMVYGRTPFANLHFIQKLQAIVNPAYRIDFPDETEEPVLDAMKQCLRRNPEERPPIMGTGGLLNEHRFLHSGKMNRKVDTKNLKAETT